MINKYTKPDLEIFHWCVTKEHLLRINQFLNKRFETNDIPIKLQTISGNDKIYDNFEEFATDIPRLLADEEIVKNVSIEFHVLDIQNDKSKFFFIYIKFRECPLASFHITAEDTDGTYKDWVVGAYEEMKKLQSLFETTDEDFIEVMKERYPINPQDENVIVFDFDGSITESIEKEVHLRRENSTKKPIEKTGEILELKPEFHGMSVNLKLLWQKVIHFLKRIK